MTQKWELRYYFKNELLRTPCLQLAIAPQLCLCYLFFFSEWPLISDTSPPPPFYRKTEGRVMVCVCS